MKNKLKLYKWRIRCWLVDKLILEPKMRAYLRAKKLLKLK